MNVIYSVYKVVTDSAHTCGPLLDLFAHSILFTLSNHIISLFSYGFDISHSYLFGIAWQVSIISALDMNFVILRFSR